MKTTFIYSLECPKTGDIRYIGKSNNPRIRLKRHCASFLLKNNTHKNNWIKLLKETNNTPIVGIVDEVLVSEWKYWEKYWISQFKQWGFNLTNGTDGGDGLLGYVHSVETRKKISNSLLGENHPNWGKKLSKETKDKIRNGNIGKIVSEDTRKKISESNMRKIKSSKERKEISNRMMGNSYNKGNKHSEETKRRISEGNLGKCKGKKVSKETRKKISESRMGIKPSTCKKVMINGIEYESITDASNKLDIKLTTLWHRINSYSEKFKEYKLL